jgi:hypothetical protein
MFPTFYILGGGVPEEVLHLCGTWGTANTGIQTIPTPNGAEDGDLQVVVVNYYGGSGGTSWTPPTLDGNPWRPISIWNSYATGSGGWQYILWRRYFVADGDLTFNNGGGASKGCYTSVILKGYSTDDPVFNVHYMPHISTTTYGPIPEGMATGLECKSDGDLALFVSVPDNASYDDVTGPSDALLFCNRYSNAGAGPHSAMLVSCTAVDKSAQHNLLKYSSAFTVTAGGWTATNAILTNPAPGTYEVQPANLDDNATSNKHYIEQEVTLQAGKRYLVALGVVDYLFTFFAQDARAWLTVLDSHGNESGINAHSYLSNPGLVSVNNTSILPDDIISRGAFTGQQYSGNRTFGVYYFYFTPLFTETHKIRIYVSRGDTDPTVGNSNPIGSVTLVGITLMEATERNTLPSFLETGASPILPGSANGVVPNVPRFSTTANQREVSGYLMPILPRRGEPRPPCKIYAPYSKMMGFAISDLSISDLNLRNTGGQWLDQTGSAPLYIGVGATHCIHSGLTAQKYYYELEPTALGTASDELSIGFAPPAAMQLRPLGSKVHASLLGRVSYCANGAVYKDGTLQTTVAAWVAGDKVGASIDFTALEIKFYRNGSVVATVSISGHACAHGVWNVHCGVNGATISDDATSLTFNFAGSFGGRKPSGFSAYDYANEVV